MNGWKCTTYWPWNTLEQPDSYEPTKVDESAKVCISVKQELVIKSIKKLFLEFRNIHRKTPVLKSLFNKVTSLQACNIIKNRLQLKCFSVNFAKFFRTSILKNIWERLLHKSHPLLAIVTADKTILIKGTLMQIWKSPYMFVFK